MRKLILLLAVLLPGPLKRLVYRRLFGWSIGRDVRIGLSFLDARDCVLGDHVHIGHLNVFLRLRSLRLGDHTHIAFANHFSGAAYPGWACQFHVGPHAVIMSRHLIDVGGTVTLGPRCILAGRDTHLWSHSMLPQPDGQFRLAPFDVSLGADTYIGARTTLIGCSLPDGAIVGAGSVVTRSFPPEPPDRLLIAGNPATIKKRYPPPATPTP